MRRILVVDASQNFIRNYTIVPLMDLNGRPNGGTFGYLKSLRAMIEAVKPTHVINVWDGAGGSQKRKDIAKEYKEGRKPIKLNRNFEFEIEDEHANKIYQVKRLTEYLDDLPVFNLLIDAVEADDVIAYLCKHFSEDQKVIVSTDKDFYQLLDDKTIIYTPTKKQFITNKKVYEEFGIHPVNFAVARSFIGDGSDNLKGVKGIGFKTILKYIPELANTDELLLKDAISKLSEKAQSDEKYAKFVDNVELIERNYKLMQLSETVMSAQSIRKIKYVLGLEIKFNATSFKAKLIQDGVTSIGDNFFVSFRTLEGGDKLIDEQQQQQV